MNERRASESRERREKRREERRGEKREERGERRERPLWREVSGESGVKFRERSERGFFAA